MDQEILRAAQIDYEHGKARFMGNGALYERMLGTFKKDTCLERARAALDAGDLDEVMARVHEVKGVSGNLDMTALYQAACDVVNCLRKQNDHDQRADFAKFEAAYVAVKDALERA